LTASNVGCTVTVSSLNMLAPFVKFIYTVYVQNGVLSTPLFHESMAADHYL